MCINQGGINNNFPQKVYARQDELVDGWMSGWVDG